MQKELIVHPSITISPQESIPQHKERNFGLDLLRSISILLVLLAHTSFISRHWGVFGLPLKGSGTLGVEVFFVLSGFLIFGILFRLVDKKKTFNGSDLMVFLSRRWLRTLPNYYFVLTISILIFYSVAESTHTDYYKYYLFLQNFTSSKNIFFASSWSLSSEEFSYILSAGLIFFSILLFRVVKNHFSLKFIIVGSLILSLVTIKLINYYFLLNPTTNVVSWESGIRTATLFRFDAILIGGILSFIHIYSKELFFRGALVKLSVGILTVAVAIYLQQKMIVAPDYHEFPIQSITILPLMAIGIALMFPFFIELKVKNKSVLFLVYHLSILSYSLYLCNLQIVQLVRPHIPNSLLGSAIAYLAIWVLSFVISMLLYRFIELPFMNLRNRKFRQ